MFFELYYSENIPRYKSDSFTAVKHYTIPEKIYMIHTFYEL
jgi:hypothetical protein